MILELIHGYQSAITNCGKDAAMAQAVCVGGYSSGIKSEIDLLGSNFNFTNSKQHLIKFCEQWPKKGYLL